MKSKVFLILFILIALILAGCGQKQETQVMDTPEKAVENFAAAVAAGNYDAAMQLCPADTMMEKFNSNLYNDIMLSDAENQSVQTVKNEFSLQTGYFAYTLLSGEIPDSDPYNPADEGWSAGFFKSADIAKLKDLTVLRSDKPYIADYDLQADSEVYNESMKNHKAVWGADGYTERIVLLKHNGKTFLAGFTLLKYGDVWGIKNVFSDFMDIPSPGGVREMSETDYLAYVKPQE